MEHRNRLLRSALLLIALLAVIAASFLPFEAGTVGRSVAGLLTVGVFSFAGYLIGARRRWLWAYVIVAGATLLSGGTLASFGSHSPVWLAVCHESLGVVLQGLLMWLVFRFSLFHSLASRLDRVLAGICGYLLLSLVWADVYSLSETLWPGGVRRADGSALGADPGDTLYFSIVTLTSTGYGDLVPASRPMRWLASMQAIVGTLYLAVFISALISGVGHTPAHGAAQGERIPGRGGAKAHPERRGK